MGDLLVDANLQKMYLLVTCGFTPPKGKPKPVWETQVNQGIWDSRTQGMREEISTKPEVEPFWIIFSLISFVLLKWLAY